MRAAPLDDAGDVVFRQTIVVTGQLESTVHQLAVGAQIEAEQTLAARPHPQARSMRPFARRDGADRGAAQGGKQATTVAGTVRQSTLGRCPYRALSSGQERVHDCRRTAEPRYCDGTSVD